MAKIAVEKPFDDIKEALEKEGFEAEMFQNDDNIEGFDLGIIRTLNDFNSDQFKFPVVTTDGKSVQDVVNEAKQKLSR